MESNELSRWLGSVSRWKAVTRDDSRIGMNSTGNAPGTRAASIPSVASSAREVGVIRGVHSDAVRNREGEGARRQLMWWWKSSGRSLKFFKSLEVAFLWSSSYLFAVAILKNSWKSRRCVLHLSPYSNAVNAHLSCPSVPPSAIWAVAGRDVQLRQSLTEQSDTWLPCPSRSPTSCPIDPRWPRLSSEPRCPFQTC
jgi:hypothetical protein